jgi:polyhydroxybutyrate depolymerase
MWAVPVLPYLLLATLVYALASSSAAGGTERVPGIPSGGTAPSSDGHWRTVAVDDAERQLLLYPNRVAAPSSGAPLVLVFHGHGGSARGYAAWLRIQERWPEAVVAYFQGVPGAAGITDEHGLQPGWQMRPGDLGDRDVHFVDAALADIQRAFAIDPDAIYALGHSNGARFVSVLWNVRGETFAAFGTAAGLDPRLVVDVLPRSVFMIMGENDPLVPLAGQSLGAMVARRVLQADPSMATTDGYLRVEPGVHGTELVTYVHPGGHGIPPETVPMLVSFFQRHSRPAPGCPGP